MKLLTLNARPELAERVGLLTATILFILLTPQIHAQSVQGVSERIEQKQQEIEETEQKLQETEQEEKSLKVSLAALDGQAVLTELKIEQAKLRQAQLEEEIASSSAKIRFLQENLASLERELTAKIQRGEGIAVWELVFPWEGFGKIKERYKNQKNDQERNKKVLSQITATKEYYKELERSQEDKLLEEKKLQAELTEYQSELASTKQTKEYILETTQNNELVYQRLLEQLSEDVLSIDRAISNMGRVIGFVKKGQQIGSVGLTGCTSGPHLHYETYKNAKVENGKVLGARTNPRSLLGSILDFPLLNFLQSRITVEFGQRYALGRHTGIDIAKPLGTPVYATHDGVAYTISDRGCRVKGFDHGASKGLVIDHGNGFVSLYWHLQ